MIVSNVMHRTLSGGLSVESADGVSGACVDGAGDIFSWGEHAAVFLAEVEAAAHANGITLGEPVDAEDEIFHITMTEHGLLGRAAAELEAEGILPPSGRRPSSAHERDVEEMTNMLYGAPPVEQRADISDAARALEGRARDAATESAIQDAKRRLAPSQHGRSAARSARDDADAAREAIYGTAAPDDDGSPPGPTSGVAWRALRSRGRRARPPMALPPDVPRPTSLAEAGEWLRGDDPAKRRVAEAIAAALAPRADLGEPPSVRRRQRGDAG